MRKEVDLQLGRWKCICEITCNVANTEFSCFTLTASDMEKWAKRTITVCPTDYCSHRLPSTFLSCQVVCCQGDDLFCLWFVNLYCSYLLLQPCCGTWPVSPSSNKTSVVYQRQTLDGNACNSQFSIFFFSLFFCKLLQTACDWIWRILCSIKNMVTGAQTVKSHIELSTKTRTCELNQGIVSS